jgi:hypothetical protein
MASDSDDSFDAMWNCDFDPIETDSELEETLEGEYKNRIHNPPPCESVEENEWLAGTCSYECRICSVALGSMRVNILIF